MFSSCSKQGMLPSGLDTMSITTYELSLRRGISKAKHFYKQRIEDHFNSSNPQHMWQGTQSIPDFKPSSAVPLPTVPHSQTNTTTAMLTSSGN